MALPQWPEQFPTFLNSGYSVTHKPNIDRTQMENGQERTVLRSNQPRINVNASLYLTYNQFSEYQAFFANEANYGASWFYAPVSTAGEVRLHRSKITSQSAMKEGRLYKISLVLLCDESINPND